MPSSCPIRSIHWHWIFQRARRRRRGRSVTRDADFSMNLHIWIWIRVTENSSDGYPTECAARELLRCWLGNSPLMLITISLIKLYRREIFKKLFRHFPRQFLLDMHIWFGVSGGEGGEGVKSSTSGSFYIEVIKTGLCQVFFFYCKLVGELFKMERDLSYTLFSLRNSTFLPLKYVIKRKIHGKLNIFIIFQVSNFTTKTHFGKRRTFKKLI